LRPQFCIHHSAFRRAFTLLELILVMLILSMLLAMVAPSLSGFGAGRDAEYAAAQVMTLSHWAREQAISEGRVYRLNFNPSQQQYWATAQVGGVFQTINDEFGSVFTLPEGVTMAWDAPQENGLYYAEFYPGGRAQPVRISITSRDNQLSYIGNTTPTEPMRAMTQEEAQAR
jgi:prepilin-type N-terminal cleavage/methylation domain-containing protein